ncbi:undecaprenyl-diphosphate phosphatase [Williamsia serinedens]|uniref:Undecaprenyl-diphosphatase n=1 Tax=Williamsia serinedens TaxID=391736 RepID=A0ABT1H6V7_9NOCA|nr:undecaprenyl-diphosphate phosphatase [Williamsia serinedens]MCP2162979.1 undecaprenyl-diphosphatase [Williamsia serinedens]
MSSLTYTQSVVMGLLQGVTELFPVSSLGHSLLVPAWIGGSWETLVTQSNSKGHTPFLAFLVALHVATALALVVYYWRDWVAIVRGFVHSVVRRRIDTREAKLAWLLIVGTLLVGIVGLVAEKPLRQVFATPLASAVFLVANGFVLLAAELLRRRAATGAHAVEVVAGDPDAEIDRLRYRDAVVIGAAQILALLPGISRSGSTISAGLLRGMDHESSAKFAFLLATPVILAAGVLKIPELFGPEGQGIGGQVIVGAVCAFVAALVAVAFLERFFRTRTMYPFVVYCLAAGVVSVVAFA